MCKSSVGNFSKAYGDLASYAVENYLKTIGVTSKELESLLIKAIKIFEFNESDITKEKNEMEMHYVCTVNNLGFKPIQQ